MVEPMFNGMLTKLDCVLWELGIDRIHAFQVDDGYIWEDLKYYFQLELTPDTRFFVDECGDVYYFSKTTNGWEHLTQFSNFLCFMSEIGGFNLLPEIVDESGYNEVLEEKPWLKDNTEEA